MLHIQDFQLIHPPAQVELSDASIRITTAPHTDLWQRTYYHFQNDNAPLLLTHTDQQFFSFSCKTDFQGKHRFDQCGIVLYLDSENWLKASAEYETKQMQHLGSVVTNHGYSDWATTEIPSTISSIWYRLSRRKQDFCVECSMDGKTFQQMRICHMWQAVGAVRFGVYACSPEDSSFQATFSHLQLTDCIWKTHTGQPPDPAYKI